MKKYDYKKIEAKWQKIWQEKGVYKSAFLPPDAPRARKTGATQAVGGKSDSRPPFYNLMMFPYPSAEGLHVGNMYAFTGTDIYGR